jgi:hypothetical protein
LARSQCPWEQVRAGYCRFVAVGAAAAVVVEAAGPAREGPGLGAPRNRQERLGQKSRTAVAGA